MAIVKVGHTQVSISDDLLETMIATPVTVTPRPAPEPSEDGSSVIGSSYWADPTTNHTTVATEETLPKKPTRKKHTRGSKQGECYNCAYYGEVFETQFPLPLCSICAPWRYACPNCGKTFAQEDSFVPKFCSLACLKAYQASRVPGFVKDTVKIDPTLFLAQEAANFYLLADYVIKHPEQQACLDRYAKFLANQLERYMLYAIGGEIRHYEWQYLRKGEEARAVCKEVDEKNSRAIADWLSKHETYYANLGRERMWEIWDEALEEFGEITMITVCMELFPLFRNTSVGGNRWATIAKTLLAYKLGEINAIVFVDTAFGLQHNNNIHLNKIWDVTWMRQVLDANKEGDMKFLRKFADKDVLERIDGKT